MARIGDLTATQLARHAENVFLFQGRHQECARLAYHCLSLDPFEPTGLICLSDILCGDQLEESGFEQFSASVLEYALEKSSPLSPEARIISRGKESSRFLTKPPRRYRSVF